MPHTFPKRLHLLRPGEFDRVFQRRCSASDGPLIVYAATNELGHPRLGLTVSRKVGGAVQRNRWKRVLREAFRLTQFDLPPLDLVCLARPASRPDLAHVMAALPRLAHRLERKLQQPHRPPRRRESAT
jgi:ribonuclease P protein component